MGNKIARTTQASASEYYLHDLPSSYNLVLKEVLGRGRFLKSIQCKHDEGLVIVKVYFKRGDSIDLKEYERRLFEIRDIFRSLQHPHVWPFQVDMVEVHSTTTTTAHYSIKAKKLWSFLRITFFMIRKGLISKRKLIMDMNLLMMKRGKVLRKTLGNYLMFHHSKTPAASGGFGIGHYEFSCTNTPINPSAVPFFHAAAKRKHHYHIPCINPPPPPPSTDELEEEFEQVQQPPTPSMVLVLPTASKIKHSSKYSTSTTDCFAPGEKKMNPVMVSSPLSLRVSNYYSSEGEEEEEEEESEGGDQEEGEQVDAAAEDFIRRFYEQLRMQNGTQLIQYQEIQYQEMLARGTC